MTLEEKIARAIDPAIWWWVDRGEDKPDTAVHHQAAQSIILAQRIIEALHLGVTRVDHTRAYTHRQITGWWIEEADQ